MKAIKGKRSSVNGGPAPSYWEDPVYHYLSRRHRSSKDAGDSTEAVRLDGLMQALVNRTIPGERYAQLETEAKADRKARKQERKRHPRPPLADRSSSVNVASLKKRIFNPNVSRENVIKAMEGLPSAERAATIATLPPGLRRKLGRYLKERRG